PDSPRSRTGRVELLPRSLPRRRGEGEGAVRRRRPTPSRRRGRMRSLRGHASPPRQHRRARRQGPGPIEPGADRQELSAPSSNTCRLLPRDHAAPEPTLALAKAASLGCERVRPLAWCSRPRNSAALLEGGLVPQLFELELELEADFADILSVKSHDFALGDPLRAKPLPEPVPIRFAEEHNEFLLEDRGDGAQTQVIFSERGEIDGAKVRWKIELEPRERWHLRVDVIPSLEGDHVVPRQAERRFGDEMTRVRESLAAWRLRVPQIRADWDDLNRSFFQSVSDLASLRMRRGGGIGRLPAAGMPWFMTVFGRDTLVTCLQTLLF